jgi:hypothetical protein
MKINFGRIFEQSLIPDQPREQLAPFIEWVQQAIDNIARALTNSLTIADNLDAQILNQTIRSTSAVTSVEFRTRKVPEALLIAQQSPTTPVISSNAWQVLPNGNVKVDITFSAAPTNGVSVRFIAFFG